jgi:hypothetical protein
LPSQYWNFLFFHITKELNNVLAAAGIAQNASVDTQLASAIGLTITSLALATPYSIPANTGVYFINSTTNPGVMNLPASTGSGIKIRVIDLAVLTTGLVRIAPNGGDNIGSAGNVSVYLQNVDQSGFVYKYQWIELTDTVAGTWDVTGGQFCPHQTVDTDGQQYYLGKLHHLPLGNTIIRTITNLNANVLVSGVNGPYTAAGVLGIPAGAKAVRIKYRLQIGNATSPAYSEAALVFSDNNSNTPTFFTAHPMIEMGYEAAETIAVGTLGGEIDVPLNASGQFYIYGLTFTNLNASYPTLVANVIGYYMGD